MTIPPDQTHAATVLRMLHAARGRAVTHGALLDAMYADRGRGEPRDGAGVLKVVICQLRRRLPKGAIGTVWGMGYRLDAAIDVAALLPALLPLVEAA